MTVAPRRPRGAAPHAVSGGVRDEVVLSRCVFKNPAARKSLTVHHVQRRLVECGYTCAGVDKDGWYADNTRDAVARFQADRSLESTGLMDEATFTLLFEGDPNVVVRVD